MNCEILGLQRATFQKVSLIIILVLIIIFPIIGFFIGRFIDKRIVLKHKKKRI